MSAPRASAAALPDVSVIIPTHQRPEFLRRAVRSVLEQDYPGQIDILVVYDASDPVELENPYPNRRIVTLENKRTRGAVGARNTAILEAKGDVIAFLDDDDEWLPGKLSRQLELLRSGEADAVYTGVRYVADGRYRDYLQRLPEDDQARAFIGGRVFLPIQSLAVRRDALNGELLDENFTSAGGDQEFGLRLALRLRLACIAEPLVLMNRAHTNRVTMDYELVLGSVQYMRRKHAHLIEKYRPEPSRHQTRFALLAYANRRRRTALTWAARALRTNPWKLRNWVVALAVLVVPPIDPNRLQALHHRIFWRRMPQEQQ